MSDEDTSSANPAALEEFVTTAMQLDARLELGAVSLRAAIAEFNATCKEYPTGIDESLADQLQDLARRNMGMNLWVRQVAEQFAQADAGQSAVLPAVSVHSSELTFADMIAAGTGTPLPLSVGDWSTEQRVEYAMQVADQSTQADTGHADSPAQSTVHPASIAQALLDSLTPEQAAQLLDMLGIANPGTGLEMVDGATQPTPFDQLAEARDDVLSFLGRVKDDPVGEAKRVEDGLGQAKDSFFGEHPTQVDMLKGLLGMLAATPGAAPPVTCADGQIRLSQDAVDLLNGQKTLNPDISRQNLGLLAAEAAARCGQMESTQQVVETEAGGIAVVSTLSPKDLWDTLSQVLNHEESAPRGNRIVETPADAGAEGSSVVSVVRDPADIAMETYEGLGGTPPRLNVEANDTSFDTQGAHTLDRHGPDIPLRQTDAPTGTRTIEGRIYGDPPWPGPENWSYRWTDSSTMNRTINTYVQAHWEAIRSELAVRGSYRKVFDAGQAIGEGFFDQSIATPDAAQAVYHQTSMVQIDIGLAPGNPPQLVIIRAFPSGRGT